MRKLLLAAFCLLTTLGWSQGTAASGIPVVATGTGQPIAGATVAICSADPGSAPSVLCTASLVTTFTSNSLSVACTANPVTKAALSGVGCTNPGLSDGLGNVIAYANPAACWLEYTGNGIIGIVVMPCTFPALSTTGGVAIKVNGGSTLTSPVNFQNGSAVNGITISFANPSASNVTAAISGALTNAGIANPATTVNGQTCTLGSTCTINGILSGLTTGVIPQAGSATSIVNSTPQLDNGVTTPNTLTYVGSGGLALTPGGAAGIAGLGQGTAQGLGTNSVGLTAPTGVTSYNYVWPPAAGSGVLKGTNIANTITGSIGPLDLTADVGSSILPPANGGTGIVSPALHKLIVGNGTSAMTQLAVGDVGTVLIGNTGADPSFSANPRLGGTTVALTGSLGFSGLTSGTVTIQSQAIAGTFNYNLPTTAGTAGDCQKSGGGGSNPMTWAACSAAFSAITSGTNTAATMTLGSGSILNMAAGGIVDLSAGTVTNAFTLPTAAGAAPITAGLLAYDSTATQPVIGNGAAAQKLVKLTGTTPTDNNCAKFSITGTSVSVKDYGGTCGTSQLIQSGLLAEYRLTDGSGTSITDSSGNGNTGTFTCVNSGTNPTWTTLGLNFVGASLQCVTLPSALNSAKTFIFAYQMQIGQNFGSSNFSSLLQESIVGGTAVTALNFISANGAPGSVDALRSNVNLTVWATGASPSQVRMSGQGTHIVSFVNGATDHIYLDAVEPVIYGTGPNTNVYNPGANAGVWVVGGNSFNTSWFTGQIYYMAFYNRVLTPVEISQDTAIINQILVQRGVKIPVNGSTTNTDAFLIAGDSIAAGFSNFAQNINGWPSNVVLANSGNVWNTASPGTQIISQMIPDFANPLGYFGVNGQRNAIADQGGRNDFIIGSATQAAIVGAHFNAARQAHLQGYKYFIGTLVSGNTGGYNTTRRAYNAYIQQHWPEFADGYIGYGEDANLGLDTASAATVYFLADGIHPSVFGNAFMQWMTQREWNWFYGNKDWTTANVYTVTAPAATAITAASDAAIGTSTSSTATYTFAATPAAFVIGSRVSITGVTPAGYNTDCIINARSGTTISCVIGVNALGAGTVFGTATVATQLEADNFIRLGGSAAGNPSFTLLSACGFNGQVLTIKNENTTSAWVLTPWTSSGGTQEQIDGANTLTMPTATAGNFPVVKLMAITTTPTAPVCGWKRVQ